MKLLGDKQFTMVHNRGIFTLRVEGFADDRFRFMFICRNSDGQDIKWIPMAFSKGTKTIDLDNDAWPVVEQSFLEALA